MKKCKHDIEVSEDMMADNCFWCKTERRFRWRAMLANVRRRKKAALAPPQHPNCRCVTTLTEEH